MKLTLIILSLSLSLISCGKMRTDRFLGKRITSGLAGLQEPASLPLSASELPIALRICQSLKAKRQFLTATITGTTSKRIAYNFTL